MDEKDMINERKEYHKLMNMVQKEYTRLNKYKDKIILTLIICMCIEFVAFFGGFIWYESQFEVTETTTKLMIQITHMMLT